MELEVPTLEELSLTEINGQQCMPGDETNLAELLLSAAEERPEGLCLETGSSCYTFAQVARMTTPVRKVLRKALQSLRAPAAKEGPEPKNFERRLDEHVVTIVLDRGIKSIVAVHAVMLEKCVYNAFDVGEPLAKLRSWVEVSKPPVMISSSAVLKRLGLTDVSKDLGEYPRLVVDIDLALAAKTTTTVPKAARSPEDLDRLAYLIFTSGSTGKPKAVMIRHKSALNVARLWTKYVGLNTSDRFAQVASMSWDVHIIEVYGTLSSQACSVTCPDLVKKSGPDMLQWLKERQITGMSVVPSHLRSMAQGDVSRKSLPHLRLLDVGGEALGADVVETWAPERKLFNSYGPSEISVVCTGTYVHSGDVITIGQALPTYTCHILDPETLQPLPMGQRGVLFVSGIGLARGYLEEEEKTKAKFLELPGIGRVYNTGDLASEDELGRIHYHGRIDWQVKVRGLRIELEALEQAITALPSVKHCEARVIDDRLVLLASGDGISAATLKSTAAALGRGYVLSQVKLVENDAWKFNSSGKLLRNAIPFEEELVSQKDGWETFDKSDTTELEQEIAFCLSPQVTNLERWTVHSHFMEELGIDSGGFGRLISKMRQHRSLGQVDLQMLFEHPTVRSLAMCIDTSEPDSDADEEAAAVMLGDGGGVVDMFLAAVEMHPHRVACEEAMESKTYLQIYRLATSYQRLIHSASKRVRPSSSSSSTSDSAKVRVAICLEGRGEQLAAMLGAMLEGASFCLVTSNEDFKASKPQLCLARSDERSLMETCDEAAVVQLASLCHGASIMREPSRRAEILVCQEQHDAPPGTGGVRRVHVSGSTWITSKPEWSRGFSIGSIGTTGTNGISMVASPKSTASELAPYILGAQKTFGPKSWPVLCGTVQGLAIFAQPVMVAARLLLAERVLLPVALSIPLWQSFVALLLLLFLEQFLRVLGLAMVKWTLIGRYREGDHDIYSLYYLRHWLVEHLAKGTIVGQSAHQGSSISFLFMRNLALKALGADVALTSVITARVVAYDLITVKDMATVHGPRHLTAVNYGTRRMVLRSVKVGAGAFVGPNCTMEAGCEVADAGYVEPLSTVSAGTLVEGRVSGVPAQVVGPADLQRLPNIEEVNRFRRRAAVVALGQYWLLLLPKALMPFISVILFRVLTPELPESDLETLGVPVATPPPAVHHFDALPPMLMAELPFLPLIAFVASMVHTILQLLITAALCRFLPKMKPPCRYPLTHWRAQVAGLKMSMVLQAAEMLADASIVPAFIRLCGAKMGPGCVMGLQVMLPETLVVGQKSFFATGNILTSVDVDRGHFNVPCMTYMGDQTFLGNHNHLPEGLPDNSFCGVGTWLPKRPEEPNFSYFGNPAMKFRRLSSQAAGVNQGPEKAHALARFWHHFSTSVMDVFLYRGVQGTTTSMAFVVSRFVCPYVTEIYEPFNLLFLYIAFGLGSWYLFSVVLGNMLFNGNAPRSNAYYSTAITRWFTALTAQQRVFKLPFQTAGSRWQAPILRLLGARVGKRFFCMNELVLVDAPFTEVGDDVTVDYDGQVRCHSFEDFRLKFVHYKIGHRVAIMSGASVAMCDAGDGAVLRPGSLTWKGSNMEANTIYEGAPASAKDIESGPGPTLLQKKAVMIEKK